MVAVPSTRWLRGGAKISPVRRRQRQEEASEVIWAVGQRQRSEMGGFGLERRLFAWRHFLDIAQISRRSKRRVRGVCERFPNRLKQHLQNKILYQNNF
jgi:hypothetical protein